MINAKESDKLSLSPTKPSDFAWTHNTAISAANHPPEDLLNAETLPGSSPMSVLLNKNRCGLLRDRICFCGVASGTASPRASTVRLPKMVLIFNRLHFRRCGSFSPQSLRLCGGPEGFESHTFLPKRRAEQAFSSVPLFFWGG